MRLPSLSARSLESAIRSRLAGVRQTSFTYFASRRRRGKWLLGRAIPLLQLRGLVLYLPAISGHGWQTIGVTRLWFFELLAPFGLLFLEEAQEKQLAGFRGELAGRFKEVLSG